MGHLIPIFFAGFSGSTDKNAVGVDLSDIIEPLHSYLLGSSSEQNIFTSFESISSCLKLLIGFGDEALQTGYDTWVSVDFFYRSKIHADFTQTYVKVAANVGTGTEATGSPENLERFLPQWSQLAQRTRIGLRKMSKPATAKALAVKPVHLVVLLKVIHFDYVC